MEAIIIDTETTDVENIEVIEMAWQSYPRSGEQASLNKYYKPKGGIALGALATHHILLEDLESCPPSDTAPLDVPLVDYWIGHNVDFDWRGLGRPEVKRVCTLAMARSIWPKINSHTLVALMYFLEGATPVTRTRVREAHGARADVGLCATVLSHIVELEGITSMSDLYGFSEEARIPKIMSFGKFKGEPISAVDRGWANWYQRQLDQDPYLLTALRRAGKL